MSAPAELQSQYNRAMAALKSHNFDEAADLLAEFLDSKPGDFEAELALANARAGQGKNAAALAILDRLTERNPQSVSACYSRAIVLERLGRTSEAARVYERVIRIKPDHKGALSKLASLDANSSRAKVQSVASDERDDDGVKDESNAESESVEPPKRAKRHESKKPGISRWFATSLLIAMVTFSGIAGRLFGAYAAGSVFGKFVLAALGLALGFWLIRRFRTSPNGFASSIGYVVAVGAGCWFIAVPIFYILVPYISNPRESNRANAVQRAGPRQEASAADIQKIDQAIADLRSNDRRRIAKGAVMAGTAILHPDKRVETIEILEGLLNDPDKSLQLRVIGTLGSIGTIETVAKLKPLAENPDSAVANAVREAIDRIVSRESPETYKAQEVDRLIADLRSKDSDRIRSAAARVGGVLNLGDQRAEVVQLLEGHLGNSDQFVRSFAVSAIGKWGTSDSIPKLEPLLNDAHGIVRIGARQAIDQIRRRENS